MTNRREFLRRLAISSILIATGAVGLFELVAKLSGTGSQTPSILLPQNQTSSVTPSQTQTASQAASQSTTTSSTASRSTSQSIPTGFVFVAPLSALSGKSSAYFNHPKFGTSILIKLNGAWEAFSALCTHAGCTVDFTGSSLYCPCHAGYFSPSNGSVQGGPPPSPLPEYQVLVQNNDLYVGETMIN